MARLIASGHPPLDRSDRVLDTTSHPRYCRRCGQVVADDALFCSSCGTRWLVEPAADTPESLVRTLEEVRRWQLAGHIDDATAEVLTADLESRLRLAAPVRERPAAPPAVAAASSGPPAPPRVTLRQWAAARQADLLLYLGAFLLVVAALVFVGGRGDGFAPAARLAILAAYTLAFGVAGLLVPRWERVREAGPVFLALGALLAPLNVVYWYTELLSPQGVPVEWVWLFGSLASTALYGALYVRGFGALYRIPAGLAALSSWEALFAIADVDAAWLGAWHMVLALLLTSVGVRVHRLTNGLLATVATTATLALAGALLTAAASDADRGQLPSTLALLTAVLALVALERRWVVLLPASAASGAATISGVLWALHLDTPWLLYPPVGLGLLTLATRSRWAPRSDWLARFGWLFATAAALSPLLGREVIAGTLHGVALLLLAAGVVAGVAWLNRTSPVTAWLGPAPARLEAPTPLAERVAFAWLAFVLMLVAISDALGVANVVRPHTAWAYLAAASAVALVLGARRPSVGAQLALTPPFLLAVALAMQPWDRWPGTDAIVLGVAAGELLACAARARGWPLAAVGMALVGAALGATWEFSSWPWWSLALVYAGIAGAWFGATGRWRHYRANTDGETFEQLAVALVPLGFTAAAYAVALIDARPTSIEVAAQAPWYRVLVVLLLASAAAALYEARRLGAPAATLVAAPLLVLALALAWPIADLPRLWLAPAYALAALLLVVALVPWRRGAGVAAIWTWGMVLLGIVAALTALPDEAMAGSVVRTAEYRVLVVLLLLAAVEVAYEARRLHSARGLVGASAIAMVAALLAIAIAEPANVQWYTAPTALYLLAVGLLAGRAPHPLSPHLSVHEAVLVAGALVLVVPPAEQSFEPGGDLWGPVVLIEGGALLAIGLVLTERWLVTAGVLAISGVALRWLFEVGQSLPYWLTLGVAGLGLLALGLLLLFQRDWWEGAVGAIGAWWRRPAARLE